jgi:hypothetical protein
LPSYPGYHAALLQKKDLPVAAEVVLVAQP